MAKTQVEKAAAESDNTLEQLRSQAVRVKEDVEELGHIAKDVAREKYEELREHAGDYVKAGRAKAKEWEENIEGQIREHPVRSILIAAGIGLVVGLLIRRR